MNYSVDSDYSTTVYIQRNTDPLSQLQAANWNQHLQMSDKSLNITSLILTIFLPMNLPCCPFLLVSLLLPRYFLSPWHQLGIYDSPHSPCNSKNDLSNLLLSKHCLYIKGRWGSHYVLVKILLSRRHVLCSAMCKYTNNMYG